MISRTQTSIVAVVCVLAAALGQGCAAATQADLDEASLEAEGEVAVAEQALARGSGGLRLGYTCSGNVCECSKAIENDCEDMTAVCTDKTVDAVIACINGWLTTHCVCTKEQALGSVRPTTTVPTLGVTATNKLSSATIAR